MLSEVYDIECLANLFTYTGYCRTTKTWHQFVIHSTQNEYNSLMEHLFRDRVLMTGYNNKSYDYPMLHHMINHRDEYSTMSGFEIAQSLYNKSQELIDMDFSSVAEWNEKILQIDLMKILHFDGSAMMTSLKDIEVWMKLESVEDMPFHHSSFVSKDDIDKILSYNKHDVYTTNLLLEVVMGNTENELYKGQNKIQLRQDVQLEFGIKCLNYNDVKIGEEINKIEYLKRNPNIKAKDLKYLKPVSIPKFTFGECIPNYISFKTKKFQDFYNSIKNIVVDTTPADSKKDKQIFPFIYNGTKYSIARGGIHSCESGRKLIANDTQILRDCDIGSQYPNAIRKRHLFPRHLGPSWLDGYIGNIQRRIDAKHLGKQTKDPKYTSLADTYKLALNGGGFGKSGEPSNWQYDPFMSLSCTIGNQFEILMLVEMFEMAGINVVSANTDGLVCLFDKKLDNMYYEICHEWEKIVGNDDLGQLEYTDYSHLIQTSVNDYIAIKTDGKVKLKGDFCIDILMNKNPSMRIVPIALKNYFVNNIPISKTIKNHTDIYDFCIRVKTNKSYQAEYHYLDFDRIKIKELSKTTRYFISNHGGAFYKKERNTGKRSGVNVGFVVTLFNKYFAKEMKDYDINYDFYIKECMKIVNKIETNQLNLF